MHTASDAQSVVQRQLDAYNARDLARFVAEYAQDVQIYRLPATQASIQGRQALADYYAAERFNRPELHAHVAGRLVVGNKVIDHEQITGLTDGVLELAAIYEVVGGKIQTVWFVSAAGG